MAAQRFEIDRRHVAEYKATPHRERLDKRFFAHSIH
jgi:hypothetical protein